VGAVRRVCLKGKAESAAVVVDSAGGHRAAAGEQKAVVMEAAEAAGKFDKMPD
jgi:hypothetical protein